LDLENRLAEASGQRGQPSRLLPIDPSYPFIPEDMADEISRLYPTENTADPIAVLKFFKPDSSWTWFLPESDPDQRRAFGLVIGHEREFGCFSLEELESLRGRMGLPVERDLHFKPKPVSECGLNSAT